MSTNAYIPNQHRLSRRLQLREAVLGLFCEVNQDCSSLLMHIGESEWKSLLLWLDTSGLALYFFDRLAERNMLEVLPSWVLARFQENLADNTERIEAMIAEAGSIQLRLQHLDIPYAVLKGFALWPLSVPRLESRSQLDLDFLIAEEDASRSKEILEEHGYRLKVESGRSWEFKAEEGSTHSLKDLYKAGKTRSAELHLEARPTAPETTSLLSRRRSVAFRGISMTVLSPLDLFLGQALHLYKHLVSELSRTAHVIEFRRHVIARYDDSGFWSALQSQTERNQDHRLRLGVVLQMISRVMGAFAPKALTQWTSDCLPANVQLWIDRYGQRIILADFPGSKLYLLLQSEIAGAGVPARRSIWSALVPRGFPPAITQRSERESFRGGLRRSFRELRFILFRLRFHAIEGPRYLLESFLWQQHKSRASR